MSNHDELSTRDETKQLLLALQQGRLSDAEMVMAIKRFREADFMEARASVEHILTHALPAVRAAALHTLLAHWDLPQYIETARYFLLDPDAECREQAIEYLQKELKNTVDMDSLSLLAQIANNRDEANILRLKAYCALLTIAGLPIDACLGQGGNTLLEAGQRFEECPWIDRNLITLLCDRWQEQVESTCILLNANFPPFPCDRAMTISRDGTLCAYVSASDDGEAYAIHVWNLSEHQYRLLGTGKPIREKSSFQQGEEHEAYSADGGREPEDLACWSFDGTHLAIAWQEGVLDIWQVAWQEDWECKHVLSYQTGEGFHAFAWGNRSLRFAAATKSELLYWEKPEITPPKHKAYPSNYAEHPLPVYEYEYPLPHNGHIEALAFSPDDTLLLTGDSRGELFLWSLERYYSPFVSHHFCLNTRSYMPVVRISWSPDGTRIVVHRMAGNEWEGIIARATSIIYLRQNHIFHFGQSGFSDILGWSPDGSLLVGLRSDEVHTYACVELFDAYSGQHVASYDVSSQMLPVPPDHLTSLDAVLSPDGRCVYWCAKSHHWLNASAPALQRLIWCGSLSLSLVRAEPSTVAHALHVLLQGGTTAND